MGNRRAKLKTPPSQRKGWQSPVVSNRSQDEIDQIRITAFHEAGHAVIAIVMGMNLVSVDIKRRPMSDGRISVGYTKCPYRATRDEGEAMSHMIQSLAGLAAEARLTDDCDRSFVACESDMDDAFKIGSALLCDWLVGPNGSKIIPPEEQAKHSETILALMKKAEDQAVTMVTNYWPAIEKVAELLLRKQFLSGAEISAIVARVF
jgi:ATP-dependent Zn protease